MWPLPIDLTYQLVEKFQSVFDAHVAEITANRRPTQIMTRARNPVASPDLPGRKSRASRPLDWWKVKLGDVFGGGNAPRIADRPFQVSATVEGDALSGIVVAQGGEVVGYSLYIDDGNCVFSVRLSGNELHRVKTPVGKKKSTIRAGIDAKGVLTLRVNDGEIATIKGGLIKRHPAESLCIGHDDQKPVDSDAPSTAFNGNLLEVKLEWKAPAK